MKLISRFSIVIALLITTNILAQQDPNFTLYNFNKNIINPAFAGANENAEITLSHRSQWLGIDNAPSTQLLAFTTPLKNNLGLGVSVIKDQVFILSQTDLAADISYKLKVSETQNLFFGLKAGGGFVDINLNNAGAPETDPLFTQNQSFFNPHLGAGVSLVHNKYYVTLSTPNFLSGDRYEKEINTPRAAVDNLSLYLGGGYHFALTDNIELHPALMMRYLQGVPTSYDISSTLSVDQKYSLGFNYRVDEMISVYGFLQLIKKLKLGISYDATISLPTRVGDDNSIEMILKYQF